MISRYDNIENTVARRCTQSQAYYMNMCINIAHKSALMHKHGCILVDRKSGDIVSTGYNTDMRNGTNVSSLHAEVAAIKKMRKKHWHMNIDMYVARLGHNAHYDWKYSRPCEHCMKVILSKTSIKNVFYSINTKSN